MKILNVHDRSVEENKKNSIIHREFRSEFTSALICNGDKYPSSSNRFSGLDEEEDDNGGEDGRFEELVRRERVNVIMRRA